MLGSRDSHVSDMPGEDWCPTPSRGRTPRPWVKKVFSILILLFMYVCQSQSVCSDLHSSSQQVEPRSSTVLRFSCTRGQRRRAGLCITRRSSSCVLSPDCEWNQGSLRLERGDRLPGDLSASASFVVLGTVPGPGRGSCAAGMVGTHR